MFFLVAVAAVMAASAGPIYLRAADQSLVASSLATANEVETGVTLTPEVGGYAPPAVLLADARSVPGGAGSNKLYRRPILTIDSQTSLYSPVSGTDDQIDLVGRSGACGHLRLLAGHCPEASGQIILSARSARVLKARIGSSLRPAVSLTNAPPSRLRVVGLYAPGNPSAAYWWQQNYFGFGARAGHGEVLDDAFTTLSGAATLANTPLKLSDWAQLPLQPSHLAAPSAPSFLSSLSSWSRSLQTKKGVQVGSRVGNVLSRAARAESSARIIITMISLQLVLLVLFVLYAVTKATNAVRSGDVKVAELRGHSRPRIAWLALREPSLLLLAALPVGILCSYLVLTTIDGHVLSAAATTTLDSLAVETAVFGCIAGLAAAALGSRSLLSGNSHLETGTSARQRATRNAAILDALGLALAAAGIAEMLGQSANSANSVSPLAYLGPGLLALGAGISAARLIPFLSRLAGRAFAWSRFAALTLATRSLAKRDLLSRQVLVPSIATGLLVFGLSGLSVASSNHVRQAKFALGANYVIDVAPSQNVDFLDAVRRASPDGGAMAVAIERASNGTTLLVDSSRFDKVASWPAGLTSLSPARIAHLIGPSEPPLRLLPPGQSLEATVTVGKALAPGAVITANLFGFSSQTSLSVSFGPLRAGTHSYESSLYGLCPGECRLDGLLASWKGAAGKPKTASPQAARRLREEQRLAASYSFRIDSIGTASGHRFRPGVMELSTKGAWVSGHHLSARATRAGLLVTANLLGSGQASLLPRDRPTVIPTLATTQAVALDGTPENPHQVLPLGMDGSELSGRAVVETSAIPRVGNDATMIDLGFGEAALSGAYSQVTFQVWTKKAPSQRLLASLARNDVRVLGVEASSTVLTSLEHSGPAFGFDLYGLAALAAAALAVGALLFSMASRTRDKRVEFSALSAVGVPLRTLFRSLVIESTAVSLTGAVVGAAAALVSASLVLSFLPEFAPGRVGPPLLTTLPWVVVLATAAGMFVLLEVTSLVASALLIRGVRPELMRLSR
jgi:putative ABC transport system permease protein